MTGLICIEKSLPYNLIGRSGTMGDAGNVVMGITSFFVTID